jgi:hypothetical protein
LRPRTLAFNLPVSVALALSRVFSFAVNTVQIQIYNRMIEKVCFPELLQLSNTRGPRTNAPSEGHTITSRLSKNSLSIVTKPHLAHFLYLKPSA